MLCYAMLWQVRRLDAGCKVYGGSGGNSPGAAFGGFGSFFGGAA